MANIIRCVPSRKYRCGCGLSLMYVPEGQTVSRAEQVSCPFCLTAIGTPESDGATPDPPTSP